MSSKFVNPQYKKPKVRFENKENGLHLSLIQAWSNMLEGESKRGVYIPKSNGETKKSNKRPRTETGSHSLNSANPKPYSGTLILDASEGTDVKRFIDELDLKQKEIYSEYEREIRERLSIPTDQDVKVVPDLPYTEYENNATFTLFPNLEYTRAYTMELDAKDQCSEEKIGSAQSVNMGKIISKCEHKSFFRFFCQVAVRTFIFSWDAIRKEIKSGVFVVVKHLYWGKEKNRGEAGADSSAQGPPTDAIADYFKKRENGR